MTIDLNTIKCGCGAPYCKVGLRFDSDPDILIIQDKRGNDAVMYLGKENVTQLINDMKEIKKRNKW